jgi:hypothetical protein
LASLDESTFSSPIYYKEAPATASGSAQQSAPAAGSNKRHVNGKKPAQSDFGGDFFSGVSPFSGDTPDIWDMFNTEWGQKLSTDKS